MAMAVRLFAQSPPLGGTSGTAKESSLVPACGVPSGAARSIPIPQEVKPLAGTMSERLAESEWIRGYREGYELGLWTGVHDARALLSPDAKVPGQNSSTRMTPYRHGYRSGYTDGYRKGYALWPGGIW